MTKFRIGDEEITEVNTSYDQEQPIGDAPQHYPAGGAEPIDARTGQDFLDIDLGEEGYYDREPNHECPRGKNNECLCDTCDYDYTPYGTHCKVCGGERYGRYGEEKLNKDGTGTARAVRGIDPNNKKNLVMKFDYVSKAGCEICAKYDGKTFGHDSPNRPVIPRLEAGDGKRPYTHPNCKCRWVKVFNEVAPNTSMKSNEVAPDLIQRARNWHGHQAFDQLKPIEKKMVIIQMLKQSLGMEAEAEEFDVLDPVPIASMATLAFNAIKPTLKQKLGVERGKAFAGQPTAEAPNYGIQSMLDNLVGKGLHETKKKEIVSKVNSDFTLENLLTLTAQALADKLGKTLGVESKANEWSGYEEEDYKKISPDVLTINDNEFAEEGWNDGEMRDEWIKREVGSYVRDLTQRAKASGNLLYEETIKENVAKHFGIDYSDVNDYMNEIYSAMEVKAEETLGQCQDCGRSLPTKNAECEKCEEDYRERMEAEMGEENIANEWAGSDDSYLDHVYYKYPPSGQSSTSTARYILDIECKTCGKHINNANGEKDPEEPIKQHMLQHDFVFESKATEGVSSMEVAWNTWYINRVHNGGGVSKWDWLEFARGMGEEDDEINEWWDNNEVVHVSNEGGRGSGKKGHQPWFLGAEVGLECETCMCITEREDGKCMICGN